jgi:2-polyprenyl-3-methyl-5-hydroxy-6-metoxy-1,4-benzoquinol methylase
MKIINSEDYHDFVFKGNKLIGEFEQMYAKSTEIPWHQDKQASWIDVRLSKELLKEYGKFDYINDLGCGFGYFLNSIAKSIGTKDVILEGCDISETCIHKAKRKFPTTIFELFNLKSGDMLPTYQKAKKRLFLMRGVLFCVYTHIDKLIETLEKTIQPNDLLFLSQNIPNKRFFAGKHIIEDYLDILTIMRDKFKVSKFLVFRDKEIKDKEKDVHWFIGTFRKR